MLSAHPCGGQADTPVRPPKQGCGINTGELRYSRRSGSMRPTPVIVLAFVAAVAIPHIGTGQTLSASVASVLDRVPLPSPAPEAGLPEPITMADAAQAPAQGPTAPPPRAFGTATAITRARKSTRSRVLPHSRCSPPRASSVSRFITIRRTARRRRTPSSRPASAGCSRSIRPPACGI